MLRAQQVLLQCSAEVGAILRSHLWMLGWPLFEGDRDITPSPWICSLRHSPKGSFVCCIFQRIAYLSFCFSKLHLEKVGANQV